MEADRDPIARPGDSGHAAGAPRSRVSDEVLVEQPTKPAVPVIRADADHMDVGVVRMVGADEADEEGDRAGVGILGDPRRPSEVLEPESRQELVHRATAPPVVDLDDEAAMVSLDRATEADRLRHRAATHAPTTAAAASTGTS